MSRCRGPHWFSYYGMVGSSSATCVRYGCDAPNPAYRPLDDPNRVVELVTVHRLSRELAGAPGVVLPLPLCWDADARQRHGVDYDPEDWFTAWDHGAIDPTELSFSTLNPELVPAAADRHVTCPDCLEWMHA